MAESLLGSGVSTVATADEPTMPANSTKLSLVVDCENPFITVLGMVAPSPDWIVQISNLNLYSNRGAGFVQNHSGHLIVYDAGTDSGRDFTDPEDTSKDQPTVPPLNIAPLVEDETDRFEGRVVGKYVIEKLEK